MKKILICMLFIFTCTLFAHKIEGMNLTVKLLEDEKILIEGFNKRAKSKLNGNKIKLFSMINNKILFEGYLDNGSLVTNIPTVPYFIYMYVGEDDVIIEGIYQENKVDNVYVSKVDRAFLYCSLLSLIFIILGISSYLKRKTLK